MSASPFEPCHGFVERLVDGASAASDPELAAHLGTCLSCFRTAAELREAPRALGLLREAETTAGQRRADPGERFWNDLTGRILSAFPQDGAPAADHVSYPSVADSARAGAAARSYAELDRAMSPRAPTEARPVSLAARLWAWLRLPIPAAACGAAAVLAIWMASGLGGGVDGELNDAFGIASVTHQIAGPTLGDSPLAREGENQLVPEEVALSQADMMLEDLVELDTIGLHTMLAGLDAELPAWPRSNNEESFEEDVPWGTNSDFTDLSAELDELDIADLEALQNELGTNI